MDGKVTLISPDDFLAEFVPAAETPMPSKFVTTPLSSLKEETSELNTYDSLVCKFPSIHRCADSNLPY